MSHTVHPYSHRLAIIRDWKSRWFGVKSKYKELLRSDIIIRQFLEKRLHGFFVSSIEIERSEKVLRVIIETSRPGVIIGRSGDGAVKLKDDLVKILKKNNVYNPTGELKVDIKEIKSPESNASIVAQMVAEGLERRLPYRRVAKQTVEKVMANRDVLGVKVTISGRLGGATIARTETRKLGRIPLQTFRSDVDYARHEAKLPYGNIGLKVWIYRGDIFSKKP
ncbi:MAG: 30S ribosomal protein S3 [Candidatus Zambryskibacteria bacterium RIFCSPHIGHO2_01_FULL_43_25]|uniref:Small ribosomal subunit protein uS3 n=1 Tax=Candidatus Zambryskibacteria bacterium RIFCSPLOWO2_01_FULL_45_21 TaxID=1802761 RepID=A0A1G2U644_9BACT|nr:MAG: 30S ribosomal protein S3 [Candidatus Zambryskibacteria bacterium RIFCSPHIGHO2_01_FULL_43_25]OHB00825.1 MAG: 30S ribosomal protein S3 [Candidatus Zambryskibacteria bacterium RIFCSPHIGHO2_12_FULL_44_12b]OHB04420.1 MAG: 30S ribosomal protein S3 [Candidatus Zambryskibacteria bacterium RIFCSPLOWO2_01_FULL_45_21]